MKRNLKDLWLYGKGMMILGLLVCFLLGPVTQAQSSKDAPVYQITPVLSKITFFVKSSVSIDGTFKKWDASLTFTSTDVSTGVLDVKMLAASVDTGSGFKDDKLKSKDFFDAEKDPYITFRSTKIVQTGPRTYDVPGTFTIRGVSKPETLAFTDDPEGKGTGEIKGTMAFDRKEFGMNSGIPFIRIADRVEVTVDFKVKRVGGSPLLFKQ
jgi:polyisoprenoid-binding protein YceI